MNRICPDCGTATFSIDDIHCPSCGTMLSHTGRGRAAADLEDVIARQTVSILRLLAEIERLVKVQPKTAAATAARRTLHEERRALVRQYQAEHKSITKTSNLMGISTRQVSRLRAP
jgi:uncharacterized Zn finger protein (UPF0148 family)